MAEAIKLLISVIIPTYRRPKELGRCLEALGKQVRPADEIVIVVHHDDGETQVFLADAKSKYPSMRVVTVGSRGQVAALNAGLDIAKGGIIAFSDDDAVPHSNWLKRIESQFQAGPKIGGVGGRDNLYLDGNLLSGKKKRVGRISWFGQIIANHHLGGGTPREADHFKGVNMSFRRKALGGIRFDERLRGSGAQYCNDMGVSLAVKRAGWKLIYDPEIVVDHYCARRYEEDQRDGSNLIAINNGAYNETLVALDYFPLIKKVVYIFFALLVGSSFTPGLAQWLRLTISKKKQPWLRLRGTLKGRWDAWKTWRTANIR